MTRPKSRTRRHAGAIRKLPSGRYQARLRDPGTNRLVPLGTYDTKADADAAVSDPQAQQRRGAWVDLRKTRTPAFMSPSAAASAPKTASITFRFGFGDLAWASIVARSASTSARCSRSSGSSPAQARVRVDARIPRCLRAGQRERRPRLRLPSPPCVASPQRDPLPPVGCQSLRRRRSRRSPDRTANESCCRVQLDPRSLRSPEAVLGRRARRAFGRL